MPIADELGGTGLTPIRSLRSYDAVGRLESETRQTWDTSTWQDVAITSHTYDVASRLTALTHIDGSANPLATYLYNYDALNRLTSKVEDNNTTSYAYDTTHQLTEDGTATYSYDANGNRTNAGYATGTGNRTINDGVWTYTYDAEGNVIKKSKGAFDETWEYDYDHRNQLTGAAFSATDGGSVTTQVTYVYDALGNRIERSAWDGTSTTVERYAYDGWDTAKPRPIGNEQFDVFIDLDGTSDLTMRRLHGPGFDEVIARIDDSGVIDWYLSDRQGSVRAIIDNSASITNTITYDAFGEITSGVLDDRYGYAGYEWDSITSLYSLGNGTREYDPATGTFQQVDPSGLAPDVNTYRYVGNGPTNGTDPSGRAFFADSPEKLNALIAKLEAMTGPDSVRLGPPRQIPGSGWWVVDGVARNDPRYDTITRFAHANGQNPNHPDHWYKHTVFMAALEDSSIDLWVTDNQPNVALTDDTARRIGAVKPGFGSVPSAYWLDESLSQTRMDVFARRRMMEPSLELEELRRRIQQTPIQSYITEPGSHSGDLLNRGTRVQAGLDFLVQRDLHRLERMTPQEQALWRQEARNLSVLAVLQVENEEYWGRMGDYRRDVYEPAQARYLSDYIEYFHEYQDANACAPVIGISGGRGQTNFSSIRGRGSNRAPTRASGIRPAAPSPSRIPLPMPQVPIPLPLLPSGFAPTTVKPKFSEHKWGNTSKPPCFPYGTLVHTPTGKKPIQSLQDGDKVLAFDVENNCVIERPIVACLHNWTQHLVRIVAGEETILATRNHPFFEPATNKWVSAHNVRPGMSLLGKNLKPQPVQHVEIVATEESSYNIEVEGLHNYFVGELGVLVHNSSFENTTKTAAEIYVVKDASGKVVYVGRTVQGIDTRFNQHIGKGHPAWKNGYKVELAQSGTWTKYEAAVWEQHFIDKHGGLSALENKQLAITEAKYNQYKNLHNPC